MLQFGRIDHRIGAEAEGAGIHLAQALGENRGEGAQENIARAGIFFHELHQVGIGDAPELAEFHRRDRGGGRAWIEKADFSQRFAGTDLGEQDLACRLPAWRGLRAGR